ncbi:hypothetical protein [Actinoplanes sp. NPDC049118]|uniref:hypothetical protein n=1 Tax=Actinoplanes sp. NPDC049118 TaxID=3155769 RepID=UPI0033D6DF72
MKQLARRTALIGTALGVPIGAAILGFSRTAHVYGAVQYCLGPEPLDYDAGGNFAITFELLARAVVYAAILTAVALPFGLAAQRRNTGPRLAAAIAVAAVAAAVVLVVDNPTSDKVAFFAEYFGRTDQAAAHCPAGRPPGSFQWLW